MSGDLRAHWLCTTMASDVDRLRQTHGADDGTTEAARGHDGADHDRAVGEGARARQVKEMAEETATPPSVLIRQWIMGHIKGAGVDQRGEKE